MSTSASCLMKTWLTDDDLSDIFAYRKLLKAAHLRIDNNLPPTYCNVCRQKRLRAIKTESILAAGLMDRERGDRPTSTTLMR